VVAALIEHGQQRVQRDIGAAATTPSATLIGRVGHDPIDPRAKRRVSPKRIDLPDHGQEGVLHGLLGVLRVTRDPRGQAASPVTVGGHQILGGRWISAAKGRHKLAVPIDQCRHLGAPRFRGTIDRWFARQKIHLRPRLREWNVSSRPVRKAIGQGASLLPHVGRVDADPTLVGSAERVRAGWFCPTDCVILSIFRLAVSYRAASVSKR